MDLELSDEQIWLAEAVETLLTRHWVEPGAAWEADAGVRSRLWRELVEFGALSVGEDGLGAIELCLIARCLGKHLAATPFIPSAAIRWAATPLLEELPPAFTRLVDGEGNTSAWADAGAAEEAGSSFDPTVPLDDPAFDEVVAVTVASEDVAQSLLRRRATIGALLAAAEAVGAAGRLLGDVIAYAGERKQFGHTIGSNQALRHLLADLYVRQSSSWSTVLYAAASLDEGEADAGRTVSIAKAYVARAAREVAHGALQVFGGIAFTDEHTAHRFLRRIVVRERQFGDAAHHERELGRALADAAAVESAAQAAVGRAAPERARILAPADVRA